MKIFIGSDHAGLELKTEIKNYLKSTFPEIECEDVGTLDSQSVDYPDYADKVSQKINKESDFGILVCGSGQGMAMRANKYLHIRAALCWDITSTKLSREHNNANVLCIGGRLIPNGLAKDMVNTFIKTSFLGGRHDNRVQKLKGKTC